MKKIATILLIALFLFNLAGYRFVFDYVQRQSDRQLEASLDKDEYNDADLLTIKVPLNVPYQNDRNEFERVDGEINYQGVIYKYVKRKMVEGQLVLLCLPNHNKMRLQSAKDDFFKTANDLVQNQQSKKSDHSKNTTFKNIISDYIANNSWFQAGVFGLHQTAYNSPQTDHLPTLPHPSPEQPPDFI